MCRTSPPLAVVFVLLAACDCSGRSTPRRGARDAGHTTPDVPTGVDVRPPPADATNPGADCAEAARWIYLVDRNHRFVRFEPDSARLVESGTLSCPSDGAGPFSMAIDRTATAWVLHQDHRMYHVDVTSLACRATGFVPDQRGLELFGMGFVTDEPGGSTETLFVAGGAEISIGSGHSTLARLNTATLTIEPVGGLDGWPELTGNGAAELWGFFPDARPMSVRRIDKASGRTLHQIDVSVIAGTEDNTVEAWAFAFWGGRYYVFYKGSEDDSTSIWRVTPGSDSVERVVANTGYVFVGAGVSTCAPIILI